MAELGEKVMTQSTKLATDIIVGILSVLREIAEIRLLNQSLKPDEEAEIREDIAKMKELMQNADNLTEKQQIEFNALKDKYSAMIIPETDYPMYKEKLQNAGIKFDTLDVSKASQRLLLFNWNDKNKIEDIKEAIFKENFYISEVSGARLRADARKEKQELVEMSGLSSNQIDLFREKAKNFEFTVINGERIAVMKKDLDKARDTMNRTVWELTTERYGDLTKQRLAWDKEFHREVYDNIAAPNGKTIYIFDKNKDNEYIEIGDARFALYKNGREVESLDKNAKDLDATAMYTALRAFSNPVILSQEEFERNEKERRLIIEKKKSKPMKSLLEKDEREELRQEEKREAYFKNLLIEMKLNMNNYGQQKTLTGIYDSTVAYSKAVENNQENKEFKEELIEYNKWMDLDDVEEFYQALTGLTPDEVQAISSHIKEYMDELQGIKETEYIVPEELSKILDDYKLDKATGDRDIEVNPNDLNHNGIDDDEERDDRYDPVDYRHDPDRPDDEPER